MQRPIRLQGIHLGRDKLPYRPSEALLAAANAALHLQTPLLLAGEPGCGKTDFAWYAARALAQAIAESEGRKLSDQELLERKPLECYVHSDTGAADLLYHYDGMARFADAHTPGTESRRADPRNYIALEPLGVALMAKTRKVLLIDEIDKAPRDLSNDLLRELDQGHFRIPEIPRSLTSEYPDPNEPELRLRREMQREPVSKPLLIVTSNAERQLPEAFLRRCVYFYIKFPDQAALQKILEDRLGQPKQQDYLPQTEIDLPRRRQVLASGVALAIGLRETVLKQSKRPGTAEIIGWLRTLLDLGSAQEHARLLALAQDQAAQRKMVWKDLPGLHCLVKLKEDLLQLGALQT